MEAFEKIEGVIEEIKSTPISDEASLEDFRIKYLGSKNMLKPLMAEIKNVPNEKKKDFGLLINKAKTTAEEIYEAKKSALDAMKEKQEAESIDVTAPGYPYQLGSRHPISLVMEKMIGIFEKLGFEVMEDREIEDDWHNFTAMNTPEDHPARDMQDTYYLKDFGNLLLRTHTSSVQARTMTSQKPPIRIIAPGRVYRNETVSARSHCQFHQIEGLYIDKNVSFADLKQVLTYFAQEMFGKTEIRLRASYFPFTEPSAEVGVYWGLNDEIDYRITKGTGWLEILGCGMVDPQVLINCDIDPEEYSGYAFGIGIERLAMLLYRISDIRYFYENDLRFIQQFSSL